MTQLKFFLFGPPVVELDSAPLATVERKALALLAYVAVCGGRHSRDALGALLWPEHEADRVFANLRHALWSLRHAGLGNWMATDRDTIGLQGDYWVDVAAFREIGRASCRERV